MITIKNVNEKWDSIKDKLSETTVDAGENSGFLEMAKDWDTLKTVLNPDEQKETKEMLDKFIDNINNELSKNTRKGMKITGRKNVKKTRKTFTIRGKKHVNELTKKKTKEPKTTKTPKEPKPKKPAYKIKPNWYKTLESFCKSVKKGSCMTYTIRTQVAQLQDRFDAKRGLNTPHIELIREIQDKLLPYANKDTKRVDLPKWESLIEKCKEAMHTITIIKKGAKEELLTTTLAGCRKRKTTRKKRK